MKTIYLLISLSVSLVVSNNFVSATTPSDTLRAANYTLSSRNTEAQTGKYKKLDMTLAFDVKSRTYTLNLISERDIDSYLEISDQDENVIYFKQTEIKPGENRIQFVAEDGKQTLFRLSFSEPTAIKPAVFIIRDEETQEAAAQLDVIR